MSSRCSSMIVRLTLVGLLMTSPGPGSAFDGARTFELQRDVRTLRPRVDQEPMASAYDLERLQRRLHEARIDARRDPRLPGLEIEARRLRWQADRNARPPIRPERRWASALAAGSPIANPRHQGSVDTPATAPSAPEFGKRVVALQRQIAQIETQLMQDETTALERLEMAAADLALLRGASEAVANDPNLIALESQLDALRERLE